MVTMLEKFNKDHLVKMLDDFFRRSLVQVSNDMFKSHQLRVSKDSDLLFEYKTGLRTMPFKGGEFRILTENSQSKEKLLDSLDRVGAFDLVSDFLPSTSTKVLISSTLNQIGSSKGTNEQGWAEWFLRLIDVVKATGGGVRQLVLIPDTNFIMRHYCSNILLPLLGEKHFKKLRFRLPRLVIFEIEAMCNRSDRGSIKKRLAFNAAREILFLKQHFAISVPQVDVTLHTGFSKIAGQGFADSWIRREIHDFLAFKKERVIFLTADLMNALAATTEGLDVFYFVKKDENVKPIKNIEQLAGLIIDIAITLEKVKIDVFVGDELKASRLVEGMWSGKTPSDWQNDCIIIS